jgi:glycosyltransferase involved in cell wall biosynthesis
MLSLFPVLKVSIIIPTYNHSEYIRKCVDSVIAQTYKNIECIIINDGSTDQTEKELEKLQFVYPSLKIYTKDNGGLSSARNTGIKNATGEIICFLDSDDYWLPNKLLNQIEVLNKGYDCVFSGYKFFDEDNLETESKEEIKSQLDFYDFIGRNPITGSASSIMIRRECVDKNGIFNTKLRSLEDLEYWFRLFIAGYNFKAVHSEDVRIMKRNNGNMSQDYLTMYYSHLNVLSYQLSKANKEKINSQLLKAAIYNRLNKIGWYAEMSGEVSLKKVTRVLKLHYCGRIFLLFKNHRLVGILKKIRSIK